MTALILEALLTLFILALIAGALFQILALVVGNTQNPRDRAIPRGRKSDRVTSEDCQDAHRSTVREAESARAFQRAKMAAWGASC